MQRFVLYLDIEHPVSLLDQRTRARHMRSIRRNCQIFREISGCGCLAHSFIWLDGSHLDDLPLLAMVISGNRTDWEHYTPRQLVEPYKAITESRLPILGICGGHQLICKAYGGRVAAMRKLRAGEADVNPKYRPGYLKERGYIPVKIEKEHPLFRGLGGEIIVHESHYCEVKRLPERFDALASSEICRVQAMSHASGRVLGVQFHPETFDPGHPDGRRVLSNFFAMAKCSA